MDLITVICIVVLMFVVMGAVAVCAGKLLARRRERDSVALDEATYRAMRPYPRAWE